MSEQTTAMKPRPLPPTPDTSAGYLRDDQPPSFCPASTTFSPDVVFRCVLAVGHVGSHRNGGMHWKAAT